MASPSSFEQLATPASLQRSVQSLSVASYIHTDTAKVRCDGNRASCKRCNDKHITCVYSESRVGKVVGKRRKRPADDSIGTVDSESWIVNQQALASMPSPAATASSSETSAKRHCSEESWTCFIADEQNFPDSSEASDALQSIDLGNRRSSSVESEVQFYVTGGLQTPDLSPPNTFRYLSPAILDATPMSRQISNTTTIPLIQRTSSAASMRSRLDLNQPEDEETVCIKLLAHLKKYSISTVPDQTFQLDLLTKSNASVRRILRFQSACNDYNCQLLLSSILTHLTTLCERLCYTDRSETVRHDQSGPGVHQRNSQSFDMRTGLVFQQSSSETLRPLVLETSSIALDVGNLLKRKPLDGFQTIGKWELYIVELGFRLQNALADL